MDTLTNKIIPKKPGIYSITNIINNKVYIGSSINLYRRLIHHKHHLLKGTHPNKHLQNSFNKYGIKNFKIIILEYCKKDIKLLYQKEQYYYNIYPNNYNIRKIQENNLGLSWKLSNEIKLKISKAHKGKIPKNLSNIQKNRRKKIAKYVNNKIVKIFNSCKEAAESINMKPNMFYYYIGMKLKYKGSKYFAKNTRYEYYK